MANSLLQETQAGRILSVFFYSGVHFRVPILIGLELAPSLSTGSYINRELDSEGGPVTTRLDSAPVDSAQIFVMIFF